MKRQLLFLTLALIIGGAMALHDIDKNSEDRGAPTPNHSDTVSPEAVKAHGTTSVNYTTDASDSSVSAFKTGFLKIIASGAKTLTLPAGQVVGTAVVDTVSLTTSAPAAVLCYVNPVTVNGAISYYPTPGLIIDSSGGTMVTAFNTWAYSGTTLTISFAVQVTKTPYTGNDGAYNFRYYVFQQSAN